MNLLTELSETVANRTIWENNKFFVNFQQVLKKCFWNTVHVECNSVFINHITDAGFCFTFNHGLQYAKLVDENVIGKTNWKKILLNIKHTVHNILENGIDFSKYNDDHFHIKVGDAENGLWLIMNINLPEFCGHDVIKRGAGFSIQVHDINRNPSFLMYPSTYSTPGYDIHVSIRPSLQKGTRNILDVVQHSYTCI